jgi:hypothetical protein
VSLFGDACEAGAPPTVDWSNMRRVSRLEYDNMARDLLGDTTQPATSFVSENTLGQGVNLTSNTYAGVSSQITTQYLLAAEALAKNAVSTPATLANVYSLNGISACATQDDACAQAFINGFALNAFRGHLDTDESSELFALYQTLADPAPNHNFGFTVGIQAVITAVLSSPWFLYVVELGDGTATQSGAPIPLSQYEIAARLAFFLWRSVPDAALMTAAGTPSSLSTPAQIQAQAQRMFAVTEPNPTAPGGSSLKALDALNDFTTQWLEILSAPSGKDQIFANWSSNTGEEMRDETLLNVSQLVFAENGGLNELLTSPSSYVSSTLASFYGATPGTGPSVTVNDTSLTGVGDAGVAFVQTSLPNRAGILTNGSILAIQSHALLPSSVLRGKMIREDILCDPIGNPPANVPPVAAAVPDGGTTRQLFQDHADPGGDAGLTTNCYGCHQFMDWIAFSLGHYDATGAYQAFDQNGADAGPVLDVTGTIFPAATGELSTTLNGATDPTVGLAAKVAGSDQAKECFALQEFRYSLGRLETASDACSAQQFYSAFTASSLNIQKLMIAIVGTDAFRYRSANDVNGACQPGESAGSSCQ